MIKQLFVQQYDVRFPALVFRMTVFAFHSLHVFAKAMETSSLLDVACNLFVADQA